MIRPFASMLILFGAAQAAAHEGHGAAGNHWHATDTWGYVAVALACAWLLWRAGK